MKTRPTFKLEKIQRSEFINFNSIITYNAIFTLTFQAVNLN